MAADGKNIFGDGRSPADQSGSDEFAQGSPGFDDLFGGGEQTRDLLGGISSGADEKSSYVADLEKELDAIERGGSKITKWRIPLMYAALGALAIMLVLILWNPLPKIGSGQTVSQKPQAKPVKTAEAEPTEGKQEVAKAETVSEPEQAASAEAEPEVEAEVAPARAVSWQLGHDFFVDGKYEDAISVYEELYDRFKPEKNGKLMRDVLDLQMGLCSYYLDRADGVSSYLTRALQSKSPAVRAISNYYLAFIDFKNDNYLSAREHAYQTLSLFEVLRDHFPSAMEKDCYFLIANALTQETIALSNAKLELPGSTWAEGMTPYHLPTLDEEGLKALLGSGADAMADAAMGPAIKEKRESMGGGRFSAVAQDAPVDEFLARYANAQGYEVKWHGSSGDFKSRSINLYLPRTIEQKIPEYGAGCAGLIVRNDMKSLTVYNPRTYTSLAFHKRLMANESMAVWRHFMHRYPQDSRVVNAHFGLAAVYSVAGQEDVAIGEYKLVASRYSESELVPHALLYSSRLKTDMKDYAGAREDLSSIVLQYPEARICDQAYLYLAQATMQSGIYDEAADIFAKVFNLNMTDRARARSSYGAAICNYEIGRFSDAEMWFERCFEYLNNDSEIEKGELYYTLARTKFALGKYEDATTAFRLALTGRLDREQYANVMLSWADTMMKHGDYAEALNILGSPVEEDLTLDQSCEIIKARAQIYRMIDLPNRAITLLNQKIEFLANAELRGDLLIELGRCYVANNELDMARNEFLAALDDLSEGDKKMATTLELADLCVNSNENMQAVDICLNLLARPLDESSRKRALSILGTAYRNEKQYEKAALAFAGVVNEDSKTQ